jgi:hypothetical protein
MLTLAVDFLKKTKKSSILQVDLLDFISNETGFSKESVRGTIIGSTPHKLFGQAYFKSNWVFCRKPARIVRKGRESNIYKVNYDTEAKKAARARIFKPLQHLKNGNIVTMAGEHGHCVKQLLDINPDFNIINCEYQIEVLSQFKRKQLSTENHIGFIGEFLEHDVRPLDFVYYDSLSYACDYMNRDFSLINKTKKVRYLAITLMGIKRFRNHGKFANWARATFEKHEDPTEEWIKHVLDNYKLIDSFYYNRDPNNNSRPMRLFLLELTDEIFWRQIKNRERASALHTKRAS